DAVPSEQLRYLGGLFQRPHKRHHHLHVRQAHIVAHALESSTLELEAGPERFVDVARGAAKSEHWILFVRLVLASADEVGILVGLEIREAHDHRLRHKCRGDLRDAFAQLLDVESHWVAITSHLLADRVLELRALRIELEQSARMHADHPVNDELEPCQADSVVRDAGEVEGAIRVADVHHDADGGGWDRFELDLALLDPEQSFVNVSSVSLGARHGDVLTGLDPIGCVAAAHDRGNAQFACNDRGMAGASPAIGHDGRSALHDWFPIGISHICNQHVATLHARHFPHIVDHASGTGSDALPNAASAGGN